MQIGELAALLKLNPRTIRFYESIRVIPKARRTPTGYRDYDETDLERIKFIKLAQSIGLPLDDIREILALRDRGEAPCGYVQEVIGREAERIDQRIAQLQQLRRELGRLRVRAKELAVGPGAARVCPIIEHQDPGDPDARMKYRHPV